jgi:hypothetical protein
MRKRVTEFMTWREDNGVTSITAVQPLHVSAWIEQQTHEHAAPTAKLRLAGVASFVQLAGDRPGDTDESVRGPSQW